MDAGFDIKGIGKRGRDYGDSMTDVYVPKKGDMCVVCDSDHNCQLCRVDEVVDTHAGIQTYKYTRQSGSPVETISPSDRIFYVREFARNRLVIESWEEQEQDNLLLFHFDQMGEFIRTLDELVMFEDDIEDQLESFFGLEDQLLGEDIE